MFRLVASILIAAAFIFREHLCYYIYPELKTITGDWDGSNALTMNSYALMLFLAFSSVFFQVKYRITYLFQFIVLWFSFADLLFRSLNLYDNTAIDKTIVSPLCAMCALVTYLIFTNYKKLPE